jgi:Domain of unknown function (DUF4118)
MPPKLESRFSRYGIALFSVLVALLVSFLELRLIHQPTMLMFVVAVVVSSWLGGLGPGLLATVLSAIAIDYLIDYAIFPWVALSDYDLPQTVRIVLFVLAGLLISLVSEIRQPPGLWEGLFVPSTSSSSRECALCSGSGKLNKDDCSACAGLGHVLVEPPYIICPHCRGTGKPIAGAPYLKVCPLCEGCGWPVSQRIPKATKS